MESSSLARRRIVVVIVATALTSLLAAFVTNGALNALLPESARSTMIALAFLCVLFSTAVITFIAAWASALDSPAGRSTTVTIPRPVDGPARPPGPSRLPQVPQLPSSTLLPSPLSSPTTPAPTAGSGGVLDGPTGEIVIVAEHELSGRVLHLPPRVHGLPGRAEVVSYAVDGEGYARFEDGLVVRFRLVGDARLAFPGMPIALTGP